MANTTIQVELVKRQIVFESVARFATWGSIRGDINNQADLISLLGNKADTSSVYTKLQVDSMLALKADILDVYTIQEVDDLLDTKADANNVYTKTETDTLLSNQYNELLALSIALS